jgi:hypothetical protein
MLHPWGVIRYPMSLKNLMIAKQTQWVSVRQLRKCTDGIFYC